VTVFGGNGLVGRKLVNKLGKMGAQVILPYRGDPHFIGYRKLAGDLGQILFSHFHLRDTDSLYKAMKHSNVVINLIGKDSETNNFDFDGVHVEGARTIARIAKEVGVQRLVHLSAMNCTPNPTPHILKNGSGFLRSKYYGELAVREEFPEAIIFRPADIWCHEDRFFFDMVKWQRRMIRRLPIWNGGYNVFKMPVFASDLALGIVNSLSDDDAIANTYEAVGPRRYEFRDLADYTNRCIQKPRENGFLIVNMRWCPIFRLRVSIFGSKLFKYPAIHWEKFEREMVSDVLTGCPTLQDLGVKLTTLEDRLPMELRLYRKYGYYDDDVGEFEFIKEKPKIHPIV